MGERKKLLGRMRELSINQLDLAKDLNMAVSTLNHKLAGKVDFKACEIKELVTILRIPPEEIYLFFLE